MMSRRSQFRITVLTLFTTFMLMSCAQLQAQSLTVTDKSSLQTSRILMQDEVKIQHWFERPFEKVKSGHITSRNIDFYSRDTTTIQIDSFSVSDAASYDLRMYSDTNYVPYQLVPNGVFQCRLIFRLLDREIKTPLAFTVTLHTNVGDYTAELQYRLNESIRLLNTWPGRRPGIPMLSAPEVSQHLIVENDGTQDFEILSMEMFSGNAVLSIPEDFQQKTHSLSRRELMRIPFNIKNPSDSIIFGTLQLQTADANIQHNFIVNLIEPSQLGNYDWRRVMPSPYGAVRYTHDGTHLIYSTLYGVAILINSADGNIVNQFRHLDKFTYQTSIFTPYLPQGHPGFSSNAKLCARGVPLDDSDTARTAIEVIQLSSGEVLDTIIPGPPASRVVLSEFLPGDSLLAISICNSEEPGSSVELMGRYGIYSIPQQKWIWSSPSNRCAKTLSLSSTGRYVSFQQYDVTYFFGTIQKNHELKYSGHIYDHQSQSVENGLYDNFMAQFSPSDEKRIYHIGDSESWQLNEKRYTKTDISLVPIPNNYSSLAFLQDEEYAVCRVEEDSELQNQLTVIHLPSGGTIVGECFTNSSPFDSFTISPDFKKITFWTKSGTIWQEDFKCEYEPYIPTGVTESSTSSISGFRLAPNPVNSLLLVSHPEVSSGAVRILDMTGRQILNLPINKQQESQLDVSSLTSGVYVLEVLNGAERQQQLFVKQ